MCAAPGSDGAHTMDTWRECPALADLCRDPFVHGALCSLLGERYRMEVHAASHYLRPGHGGQNLHQDGNWCNFGGWNRHLRRWHLVRKAICFYYPHDVVSAPSEVVPGSQYWTAMTPDLATESKAFSVPAGSFVIMVRQRFSLPLPVRFTRCL